MILLRMVREDLIDKEKQNKMIYYSASPKFNSHAWQIFELDPCDGNGRVCLVYNSVRLIICYFR